VDEIDTMVVERKLVAVLESAVAVEMQV